MEEKNILCFGDSNTHGTLPMADFGDLRRLSRGRRWPGVMATALGPRAHVIEEGHGGRTSVHCDPYDGDHKNGAMILPALLESHRPLHAVIIMLGTNDLKAMFNVGPQDIALSLERLHRIIRAAECGPGGGKPDVLFVAPVAIVETGLFAQMFAGGAAKNARLADEIAIMAARVGAGFFDANSVASVDPVEGIHLDADGHHRLGSALADWCASHILDASDPQSSTRRISDS